MLQQKQVQGVQHFSLVEPPDIDLILVANHLDELQRGSVRAVDDADFNPLGNFFQKKVEERCLAGPDFAGHHHETLVLGNGILQVGVSVFVPPAHVKVLRIRVQIEGFVAKTVKGFVHGIRSSLTPWPC